MVTNTDLTPVVRWTFEPNPFGDGTPVENPAGGGVFKYHLRLPGQYFDIESNLAYNYFRDYDSAIGRYVESDPIGLDAGLNTYEYVDSSPVELVDPFGLQAIPIPAPRPAPIPFPTPGSQPVPGKHGSSAGRAIGQAVNESGVDRSELGRPMGRGRYWCLIRCQGVEITGPGQGKGVSTGGCCPEWIYGLGLGLDPEDAWNNAWDAANVNTPAGCMKRHCQGKAGSCKNWKGGKR
jgi:RHS repeat-associated protein